MPQPDRLRDRAAAEALPLRPFRAVRYDPTRVGELAAVLGPPDDVPSTEQAAALAARHPYHCLHLEIPDADGRSFTRAARLYRAWRAEGVLRRDAEPAGYVYAHRFVLDGTAHDRLGVFLAASLDPKAGARLLPHEGTSPEFVERRVRQLEAVQAHAGAVYAVWTGDGTLRRLLEKVVEREAPLWSLSEGAETQRLWAVTGTAARELAVLVASRPLVIADGHHRFAAARRLAQGASAGRPGHAWVPVHVVDAADPALLVRPIHRLLTWFPGDWDALRAHLARHASIVAVSPALPVGELVRLAGELGRSPRPRVLILQREEFLVAEFPPGDGNEPDAVLVDSLLLRHVCALDGTEIERVVEYTPDAVEAARAVASGRAALAVLLRPTPLATVLAWALTGRLLPPKTTYFFPKLPQGILFYDLADPLTLA
ncbi:MAG: DUF1015 domain-containing protein [Thermomicrobium sp.]|nr:DUF1015 domain-containing protein [Thermomicrobium sp.]MDW8058831.1 DUF1015 domain-containing protein [Thermomicrobium sp.]